MNENHCESCDCEAKNSNRDLFLQSVITDIVAVTVELSGIAYGVARGAFSYSILPQSSSLPPLSLGWQRHHNVRSREHALTRQLYRVFTRGDRRHDRPHVCLHEKTVGAIVGATDRSLRPIAATIASCKLNTLLSVVHNCDCDVTTATTTTVLRHATSCSQLWLRLWCNCDVTATRNKHVHFSAKLYEVATNRSAGIDMGVVDQLWRHCYFFYVFRLSTIKAIYCLLTYFSFNYVDFMRYWTWITYEIDDSKWKYDKIMTSLVLSQSHHSHNTCNVNSALKIKL